MPFDPYPLLLRPVYRDYLWGGSRISELYQRRDTPALCAESWEVSALPDGASVVLNGYLAGSSLAGLAAMHGAALTGAAAPAPQTFPLLFKVIDAREQLSVQVHPGAAAAAQYGGEAKNEAWVILDCPPGARLFAGLKSGVDAAALRRALADNTVGALLNGLPVRPGDALFIPGGLVHAIGAGCLIYEVQQSSNTTYRLYDWGRLDKSGRPRQLHIEEALRAINWDLQPPPLRHDPAPAAPAGRRQELVDTPYFNLSLLRLTAPQKITGSGATFHALFARRGSASVSGGGQTVTLAAGGSCLVPAATREFTLQPCGSAELLLTTLPS